MTLEILNFTQIHRSNRAGYIWSCVRNKFNSMRLWWWHTP